MPLRSGKFIFYPAHAAVSIASPFALLALDALNRSLDEVNLSSTTSQTSERSVRPLRKTEVALTPSAMEG